MYLFNAFLGVGKLVICTFSYSLFTFAASTIHNAQQSCLAMACIFNILSFSTQFFFCMNDSYYKFLNVVFGSRSDASKINKYSV